MREMKTAAVLFTALTMSAVAQPTVTIEKVVRSVGNSIYNRDLALTDPVPGRSSSYVFWSSAAEPPAPVINEAGHVAFMGFSALTTNINSGAAFGIYAKRPGFPLQVLMDTTGTFPVPGQPADTNFITSLLEPPLINDAGDVVFFARFNGPTSGVGEGIYATNTAPGSPLVKIVDTSDPVPGHLTGTFVDFRFLGTPTPSTLGISLNDNGEVAYWADFCLEASCTSATMKNGVFGATVAGGPGVLLADSTKTICPTGIPFGLACDPTNNDGFWEIRPEIAINNMGIVAFHGGILGSPHRGTFSIPVDGSELATTVAYRSQTAPPATASAPASTYQDRFDDNEINDAGDYLFLPLLTAPCCQQKFGLFSGDVLGGTQGNVVDTLVGNGLVVPGDIAGAEFATISMAPMNESGQLGFYAAIRNSGTANNNGIYAADIFGGPMSLVMDRASQPPDLPVGSIITSFGGRSAVINDEGHMAFTGSGSVPNGTGVDPLYALYFYDSCTEDVVRVSDSTTALAELGVAFGGVTTGGSIGYQVYQSGEARSGHYRSINNNNQVAFLAKFSNFGMGMYIAHVDVGAGGAVTIDCPDDQLDLECPAGTSPADTGEATAGGCGDIAVTHSDSIVPGCGDTETITRTWTADNGAGGIATCDQLITVVDSTPPAVTAPADVTVECDADSSPASTGTATVADNCDDQPAASYVDTVASGTCANESVITRTWSGTDGCGNSAAANQVITVVDTSAPSISSLDGTPLLVAIGDPVSLTATFADNCSGPMTATWDWGDGTVDIIDPATSPTSDTHSYVAQEIYVVAVTVDDGCGNTATDEIVVVAFDPNDGFTTGGGWFIPDADSYVDSVPVTDTIGKANFGFVVKYKQGASTPTGSLEFVYKSGDIDLHSLDMEWLVITSASKVRFKGLASINGEGEYTFKVTAEDNGDPGSNDTFKIEIWTGVVDTENGPPSPKHKAQGVLGGGNIKIHQ